jgi:benzoate membrane transport protein
MASQQLPGVAMIRSAGYVPPISPLITVTGLTTLLLAPMGAFAICIAAVTAAIPLSPEAHPDKTQRYWAGIFAGVFYTITGLLGATIVALFAAFPPALIIGLAGMALFGTLANGLTVAMSNDMQREAALITFLVTASGVQLFGIGSAFWGLVMGGLTLAITHYARLK